jgi:hypothetical protein
VTRARARSSSFFFACNPASWASIVMRRESAALCSSVVAKISSRWKFEGFARTSSTFARVWSSRAFSRLTSVSVDSTSRSSSRTSAVIFFCSVRNSLTRSGAATLKYPSPVL